MAYIGPGLLYLGVHGGRFLELTDDFFGTPREDSTEQENQIASETTTLIGHSHSETEGENSPRDLDGYCKTFIWYLVCMPLWCAIAKLGKDRVIAHARSLAAKNTLEHNRIGGVDYTGIEKLANTSQLPRGLSNPDLKNHVQKGKLLAPLKVDNNLTTKTKECLPSLERDPQEDPPAWTDFVVAVFFICFGVVALFAGLISLASNTDD